MAFYHGRMPTDENYWHFTIPLQSTKYMHARPEILHIIHAAHVNMSEPCSYRVSKHHLLLHFFGVFVRSPVVSNMSCHRRNPAPALKRQPSTHHC